MGLFDNFKRRIKDVLGFSRKEEERDRRIKQRERAAEALNVGSQETAFTTVMALREVRKRIPKAWFTKKRTKGRRKEFHLALHKVPLHVKLLAMHRWGDADHKAQAVRTLAKIQARNA